MKTYQILNLERASDVCVHARKVTTPTPRFPVSSVQYRSADYKGEGEGADRPLRPDEMKQVWMRGLRGTGGTVNMCSRMSMSMLEVDGCVENILNRIGVSTQVITCENRAEKVVRSLDIVWDAVRKGGRDFGLETPDKASLSGLTRSQTPLAPGIKEVREAMEKIGAKEAENSSQPLVLPTPTAVPAIASFPPLSRHLVMAADASCKEDAELDCKVGVQALDEMRGRAENDEGLMARSQSFAKVYAEDVERKVLARRQSQVAELQRASQADPTQQQTQGASLTPSDYEMINVGSPIPPPCVLRPETIDVDLSLGPPGRGRCLPISLHALVHVGPLVLSSLTASGLNAFF